MSTSVKPCKGGSGSDGLDIQVNSNLPIQVGSKVRMHFSLSLEDGTLVDSSADDGGPLSFVMGDGTLTPGLEAALLGLKAGDTQSLAIEPGIAFDLPDPEYVHFLAKSDFEASHLELEPNQVVEFQAPNGETAMGTVLSIGAESVEVDFNHPLAGRALQFEVTILAVEAPTAVEPDLSGE